MSGCQTGPSPADATQDEKRLADPATRAKIVAEMKQNLKEKGFTDYSFAYVASYAPNPEFNGKNIAEITDMVRHSNKVDDQIDQILEMYDKGGAGMVYRTMSEDDVRNIMREPFTMIASDSSVREFNVGMPHPRGYGDNARVLGEYVRNQHVITLEDAIRKMTSLPAQTFSLRDRGQIREGFMADLVIFDDAADHRQSYIRQAASICDRIFIGYRQRCRSFSTVRK